MTTEDMSTMVVATKQGVDTNWKAEFENELQRLDLKYGPYSLESARELRDTKQIRIVNPIVGGDWVKDMRSSPDPVSSALQYWSVNPDKNMYHSKEILAQMIDEFPESAQDVQDMATWIYFHRCLEEGKPTVTLYRAIKSNYDPPVIRSWETLTDDRGYAQSLCNNGDRVLVTYEVPATSIFASHLSNAGLAGFEASENEVMLNTNGGLGAAVVEVDKSGMIINEMSQQLEELMDDRGQKGIHYDDFIQDAELVDMMANIPDRARGDFEKRIKERFNVAE